MHGTGLIGLVAGAVAAAFFIWLTVRVCNRHEHWAITLAQALAAGAVLIVLASHAAPEVNGSWWSAVCAVAFSPDGNTLAAGLFDGKARTGSPIDGLPALRRVASLAYSPDGRLLALGDWSGGISVWDVKTRSRLWSARMSGPHRWPGFWTIVTCVSALVLIPLKLRQLTDHPGWTAGRAGETHESKTAVGD